MGKYVRLFEDVGDSIAGSYADALKQYVDTKTAAIEDAHAVEDPNAGEGRRIVKEGLSNMPTKELQYLRKLYRTRQRRTDDPGKHDEYGDAIASIEVLLKDRKDVSEDTTNPPSAQQQNGQEMLANDDLSNFAVTLTNNESVVGFENMSDDDLDRRKKEAIRRKYSTKSHKSEKEMAAKMVKAYEEEQVRRKHSSQNTTNEMQKTNEKQSPKLKHKMKKVMHEFSEGRLKTSAGKTVTDPKQAVAIGYSEAGESKKQNESASILRFEQFVNEMYGPEQEKMEKERQKAEQALASTTDKASAQKKVSDLRKDIAKSVSGQ